ncbi:MAG: hypothetical protein IPN18_08035 [Ignavibacteriales bacterium]|nr:hypothetical protein [Ignavibacteriales bacterium]
MLHNPNIFAEVSCERAPSPENQGGCQVPIAAHAIVKPNGSGSKPISAPIDGTGA